MATLIQETPAKRAALVGGITAYLAYLVHNALAHSPWAAQADAGTPPSPTVLATALVGLGVAAALLATAQQRKGAQQRPGQAHHARHPHTLWSLALACALPIAQIDGVPLPAAWVAGAGLANGAWWTCVFAALAVGVAAMATRAPSAWLTHAFPTQAWPLCHALCAWGAWGTAAVVAFPFLPALVLM